MNQAGCRGRRGAHRRFTPLPGDTTKNGGSARVETATIFLEEETSLPEVRWSAYSGGIKKLVVVRAEDERNSR